MSATEEALDFGLHQRAREVLGDEEGDRLMSRLLPVAWYEVATKQDIEAVRTVDLAAVRQDVAALQRDVVALQRDVAAVRQDVAALRKATKEEFAKVRAEIRSVESGLDAKFEQLANQLMARMDRGFRVQAFWLLTLFVGMCAALAGFLGIVL